MKIFIWITLLFPFLSVAKESCKLEQNCECTTQGITLRWEYQYCMNKLGTDDFESNMDSIETCVKNAKPKDYAKRSACDKNTFWRKKICELTKKEYKSVDECMTSEKSISRFIQFGP